MESGGREPSRSFKGSSGSFYESLPENMHRTAPYMVHHYSIGVKDFGSETTKFLVMIMFSVVR